MLRHVRCLTKSQWPIWPLTYLKSQQESQLAVRFNRKKNSFPSLLNSYGAKTLWRAKHGQQNRKCPLFVIQTEKCNITLFFMHLKRNPASKITTEQKRLLNISVRRKKIFWCRLHSSGNEHKTKKSKELKTLCGGMINSAAVVVADFFSFSLTSYFIRGSGAPQRESCSFSLHSSRSTLILHTHTLSDDSERLRDHLDEALLGRMLFTFWTTFLIIRHHSGSRLSESTDQVPRLMHCRDTWVLQNTSTLWENVSLSFLAKIFRS